MISIEIGHLSSTFNPDLVFTVLGKVVQTANVESKFPTFCELADKQTRSKQFFPGNIGGHARNGRVDIEDSISDESKDRFGLGTINEIL